MAKTIGSRPMALMSLSATTPGPERPMKTSAPWSASLAEPRLDVEAPRRGDILQVDPAEDRRDGLHDRDDLVRVLGRQAHRERVHAGELLEDERLALHHRLSGARADVAQAQDRGAVGHD